MNRPKKEVTYLKVTEGAITRVFYLIEKRLADKGKQSLGIRVGIKQKGCSGMTYNIEYADESNVSKYDDVLTVAIGEKKTVIYIDPKISMFIIGSTMDYVETEVKTGFVFENPNEKGKCGCGESFYA